MTLLARAGAALAAPTLLLCLLGAPPATAAEAPFRAAPDLALPLPASPRTATATRISRSPTSLPRASGT